MIATKSLFQCFKKIKAIWRDTAVDIKILPYSWKIVKIVLYIAYL